MTDSAPPPDGERERQVQRLVEGTIELSAEERATFLDRVCADDWELRRAVEQRLPVLWAGRPFSSRLPAAPAAPTAIGERIHNYEIVSKIGEGGMGVVYLARHQFFERNAALKVLHPHLTSDSTLIARLMNEARAANAIRHPNIIEVIDTGFLPGSGAPYVLMEHLTGESLGALLRRVGRLPLETALPIVGQTASALAATHDQGIVHRDLKPENLFLVPRAEGGSFVKVLDFGIAKLRLDLAGKDVNTQPGMLFGTPRYMSPEQCRGTVHVDHRADIYALGIILYEMLSGVPPFDSESVGELLAIRLTTEPVPLSAYLPDIPPFIEQAVLRALSKNAEDRYSSMREFRAALGSAAIPMPTPSTGRLDALPGLSLGEGAPALEVASPSPLAMSPPAVEIRRLPEPAPRRRRTLLGLAALLLFAVAGGGAFWMARGERQPPAAAYSTGGDRTAVGDIRLEPPEPRPRPGPPTPPPSSGGEQAAATDLPGTVAPPGTGKKAIGRRTGTAGVRRAKSPAQVPGAPPAERPAKKYVPPFW